MTIRPTGNRGAPPRDEEDAGAGPALLGPHGSLVPDVRRIAVLRSSWIGDLVLALPALAALRAAYPAAEIT